MVQMQVAVAVSDMAAGNAVKEELFVQMEEIDGKIEYPLAYERVQGTSRMSVCLFEVLLEVLPDDFERAVARYVVVGGSLFVYHGYSIGQPVEKVGGNSVMGQHGL